MSVIPRPERYGKHQQELLRWRSGADQQEVLLDCSTDARTSQSTTWWPRSPAAYCTIKNRACGDSGRGLLDCDHPQWDPSSAEPPSNWQQAGPTIAWPLQSQPVGRGYPSATKISTLMAVSSRRSMLSASSDGASGQGNGEPDERRKRSSGAVHQRDGVVDARSVWAPVGPEDS